MGKIKPDHFYIYFLEIYPKIYRKFGSLKLAKVKGKVGYFSVYLLFSVFLFMIVSSVYFLS